MDDLDTLASLFGLVLMAAVCIAAIVIDRRSR